MPLKENYAENESSQQKIPQNADDSYINDKNVIEFYQFLFEYSLRSEAKILLEYYLKKTSRKKIKKRN